MVVILLASDGTFKGHWMERHNQIQRLENDSIRVRFLSK